jgi:LmbE family N-acetylglucosaminyl deacetylase
VLSRASVDVRVVFARTNWTRWVHPTPGRAPLVGLWRRAEETAASLCFGYRWSGESWSESMLRTGQLEASSYLDPDADLSTEPLVDTISQWLAGLVRPAGGPPDLLLVPAGLGGHVDHRILACAAGRMLSTVAVPVGFYEDRPYASHLDDAERFRQLAHLGADPEPVEFSGPVQASTHRLVRRCYPSQIDEYFVRAMELDLASGAPERVWFRTGWAPDWL